MLHKFYDFAESRPDAVAVVDYEGKRQTSYKDFVQVVNSIAYNLKGEGVCKGDTVIVNLGRVMEAYATFLACYFIGAIYVPLDLDYPHDRRELIIKQTKPKFVVNEEAVMGMIFKDYPCQIDDSVTDYDKGSIYFTSGTTGTAKGVVHNRTIHKVFSEVLPIDKNFSKEISIVVAYSPLMFLLSITDFMYLYDGSTVHLLSDNIRKDFVLMKKYFSEHKITTVHTIPKILKALLPLPDLKTAIVAGDFFTPFYGENIQIYNMYGCTEAFPTSYGDATKETKIGKTFSDGEFKIVDDKDHDLGDEQLGELCYSGSGMFVEYLGDPFLTKKNLVYDQVRKKTFFHTGDMAVRHADGSIELKGRKDNIFKIKGSRVNITEIENIVKQSGIVKDCAIKAIGGRGKHQLSLFYCNPHEVPRSDFEHVILKHLPKYMVPSFVTRIDKIPLNTNGKVDRDLLPDLIAENVSDALDDKYLSVYENLVDVLGRQVDIDEHSNLLDIGLDSLLAIEFLAKCSVDLNVNEFIDKPCLKTVFEAKKIQLDKSVSLEICDTAPATEEMEQDFKDAKELPEVYLFSYNIPLSGKYSISQIKDAIKTCVLCHPSICSTFNYVDNCLDSSNPYKSCVRLTYRPDLFRFYDKDDKNLDSIDVETELACKFIFLSDTCLRATFSNIAIDGVSVRKLNEEILAYLEKGTKPKMDNLFSYLQKREDKRATKEYQDTLNDLRKRYYVSPDYSLIPKLDAIEENSEIVQNSSDRLKEKFKEINVENPSEHFDKVILATLLCIAIYNKKNRIMLAWLFNGRNNIEESQIISRFYRELLLSIDFSKHNDVASVLVNVRDQINYCRRTSFVPYLNNEIFDYDNQPMSEVNILDMKQLENYEFVYPECTSNMPQFEIEDHADKTYAVFFCNDRNYSSNSIKKILGIFSAGVEYLINHEGEYEDFSIQKLQEKILDSVEI